MKPIKHAAIVLITLSAFGLAACTQAPSDGLSGSAIGDVTEVAPVAEEPTVESQPVTEAAPPESGAPSSTGAEGEGQMIPEGFVAPADPKAAARAGADAAAGASGASDASGQADAVGGESTTGVSTSEAQAYVAAHNRWRANYGTAPVVWDAAIAAFAQQWADQQAAADTFDHRQNNQYGENLWKGTAGFWGPNDHVDNWGSEVQYWDLTCTGDLEQCCRANWWECGHFTQVVWSGTTKIGCGKARTARGDDIVVCNYSPAGNMSGVSPFPPLQATPTARPAATATTRPGATTQPGATATTRPAATATSGTSGSSGSQSVSKSPNLAIPDAGGPVEQVLKVDKDGRLSKIGVVVQITHPYVGDLSITLVHPDGTAVMLRNQTGGDADNINQTYGNQGVPVADLATLLGKPIKGDWKLVVEDHAEEDAGTLTKVTLKLDYTN